LYIRLFDSREADHGRRAQETVEQRLARLQKRKQARSERKLEESVEELDNRRQSERDRAALRRSLQTLDEKRAEREKNRTAHAEQRERRFVSPLELIDKEHQALPNSAPSAAHRQLVASYARKVLLTPASEVCAICDELPRPGKEPRKLLVRELPASSDIVLASPEDLHPDLAVQYCIASMVRDVQSYVRVKPLLLSPRGVGINPSGEVVLNSCESCLTSLKGTTARLEKLLKSGKLSKTKEAKRQKEIALLAPPRFAIANKNFCGVMPEYLAKLKPTKAELAMISPVFKTGLLVVVRAEKQKGGPGQYKMESHTSSYELDVKQVIKSLPLCPEDVPFKVLITGPKKANLRAQVGERFNVRRAVVRKLLLHLKACNQYFRDIVIDEEMLLKLPENAMLKEQVVEEEVEEDSDEKASDEVASLNNFSVCYNIVLLISYSFHL
jgi:hypothetical protein